ncbi:Globin [Aphelenchoides besseyi]|nr:Globin [Aphelenchoides besseyi]
MCPQNWSSTPPVSVLIAFTRIKPRRFRSSNIHTNLPSLTLMGAKQSSEKNLTLAEKRYRISPRPRRRSQQRETLSRMRTAISLSDERSHSTERIIPRIAHSHSADSFFFADTSELLNRSQRQLVEASWKRSRKTGADNIGSRVFLLVLTADPEIKGIFGLEKIPQGRLKYDPRFRKHSGVITRTFDFAVKNLAFAEKLAQHFQSLGKKHQAMEGRGFKASYWGVFADCMLSACESSEGRKCKETIAAWKIAIAFIVRHMKIGFERERTLKKRVPTTATTTTNNLPVFPSRSQTLSSSQRQLSHPRLNDTPSLPSPSPTIQRRPVFVGGPERSISCDERGELTEQLSRLRMSASERKNPRERDNSPHSSETYWTPETSRRILPDLPNRLRINF